ncbi:hypothetical protein PhCBS80983_g01329 [Powellomyces hirtus]|uniref:Adenine DNA glycosylase n=1 Tax=Powellomyces hirtus TaxID=109895 RepID=A0A507EB80_9FUNG|nr:hypothetical protein PhCBS80983_g01329 [Powellomyces hirtus]
MSVRTLSNGAHIFIRVENNNNTDEKKCSMFLIPDAADDTVARSDETILEAAFAVLRRARVNAVASHAPSYHRFVSAEETEQLRAALLRWYDQEQREMPWRTPCGTKAVEVLAREGPVEAVEGQRAYEVWISEIMLQQTQVATVIPYYRRWLAKWPTIHDLAAADGEDVHSVWSGLGYYSRARRLHEGAQLVVKKFNGILPRDPAVLEKEVPGVGPYTAGAITSIAYNVAAPLVDGNVIRVVSRLRAIAADPKSKKTIELHWALATELLDPKRPGHFNQALMDLGATVCTPVNPDCPQCPVKELCRANAESKAMKAIAKETFSGTPAPKIDPVTEDPCDMCPPLVDIEEAGVTRYPAKAKKKPPRVETCVVCVLEHCGDDEQPRFLLVKGPKEGLLANLWDFPNTIIASEEGATEVAPISYNVRKSHTNAWLATHAGVDLASQSGVKRMDVGSARHLFSHIRREMLVEHVILTGTLDLKGVVAKKDAEGEVPVIKPVKKRSGKVKAKTSVEDEPKSLRWVTEEEMVGENQAVPATLKKAFALISRIGKKASGRTSTTRRREPTDVKPRKRPRRHEEDDSSGYEDESEPTASPAVKGSVRITRSTSCLKQSTILGFFTKR